MGFKVPLNRNLDTPAEPPTQDEEQGNKAEQLWKEDAIRFKSR